MFKTLLFWRRDIWIWRKLNSVLILSIFIELENWSSHLLKIHFNYDQWKWIKYILYYFFFIILLNFSWLGIHKMIVHSDFRYHLLIRSWENYDLLLLFFIYLYQNKVPLIYEKFVKNKKSIKFYWLIHHLSLL